MTISKIICESKDATEILCSELFDLATSIVVYPWAHEIVLTSPYTPNDISRHLDAMRVSDRIYKIEAM